MTEHICENCGARLEDQFMFDPQSESYVCKSCSTELYKKGDTYQILHRCPQCDSVLNNQFFFDPSKEKNRCGRCRIDLRKENGRFQINYICPACRTSLNEQFTKGPTDYWVCRSCHQKLKMDFYKYIKIHDDFFPEEYELPEEEEIPQEQALSENEKLPENMAVSKDEQLPEDAALSKKSGKSADTQEDEQFHPEEYFRNPNRFRQAVDADLESEPRPDQKPDQEYTDFTGEDLPDEDLPVHPAAANRQDADEPEKPSLITRFRNMRSKVSQTKENIRYKGEVARDTMAQLYSRALITLKVLLVLLVIAGIGIGYYEIRLLTPVGYRSANLLGMKVDSVVSKLETSGFTRIVTEEIEDLDGTHSFQSGLVSDIRIGWADSFEKESKYPSNFKVTITYHSMKPIPVPFSSRDAKLLDYESAIARLEDAGFTNIRTEKSSDLLSGLLKKEGQVIEVRISGKNFYQEEDEFKPDVEIVIKYYGK